MAGWNSKHEQALLDEPAFTRAELLAARGVEVAKLGAYAAALVVLA